MSQEELSGYDGSIVGLMLKWRQLKYAVSCLRMRGCIRWIFNSITNSSILELRIYIFVVAA